MVGTKNLMQINYNSLVNSTILGICDFVMAESIQHIRSVELPTGMSKEGLINVMKTATYEVSSSKLRVSFVGHDFIQDMAEKIFQTQFLEKGVPIIKERALFFTKLLLKLPGAR